MSQRHVCKPDWPLRKRAKHIDANSVNIPTHAPSVAEADEILARFGYVDAQVDQLVEA